MEALLDHDEDVATHSLVESDDAANLTDEVGTEDESAGADLQEYGVTIEESDLEVDESSNGKVQRYKSGVEIRDMTDAWRAYKASPESVQLRNILIEHYLPLVKYLAEKLCARLPDDANADPNDFIAPGTFGLMDAIVAFDLMRGIRFETYCSPRINGAMLDEMRRMDWVPRRTRERSSKVKAARNSFYTENGREPTSDELAVQMEMTTAQAQSVLDDATPVKTISLNKKRFETDSYKDVREIDIYEDHTAEDPAARQRSRDTIQYLLRGLEPNEQEALRLYYFEGLEMKEIGRILGVSESRISQMHGYVIAKLAMYKGGTLDVGFLKNKRMAYLIEETQRFRRKHQKAGYLSNELQERDSIRVYNALGRETFLRSRDFHNLTGIDTADVRNAKARWKRDKQSPLFSFEEWELAELLNRWDGVEQEFRRKPFAEVTPLVLGPRMQTTMRIYHLASLRGTSAFSGGKLMNKGTTFDIIRNCEKIWGPQTDPLL